MIILLGTSALYMSALQAGIAGPTASFRGCLHEAAAKAKTEKVAAEGIEAYLKKACTTQMGSLDEALVSFRMKNGMSRKAAASDAAMTLNDYVSTPADNYRFAASQDAKMASATAAPPAAAPTAKAMVTPAAAPAASQPPKP
jgi:hypothetical protein